MATKAWSPAVARITPGVQKSITAATTAGAGTEFDFGLTYPNWALQVTVTGTTTNVKAILQGGLTTGGYTTFGSTWDAATNPSGQTIYITGKPSRFARAVITTCASTSSIVSAWLGCCP